ncbi:TonB-dependent SusC/RagA subfamily outer membrane receptor [Pedobacter sp. CAN_A7]|uniref:carboxypeptidase-like regulatory domain-containing protein n=1 Tax=Pedobacter sp. CAN_A7 TaxID=2787722 RepID=UPI0018CB08FB
MKTRYHITVMLLLGASLITAFKINEDPFSLILKKMEAYIQTHPQEKVHLHLDKPYYAIGDDIWFKAYVINTQDGAPSRLSASLYVELLNESDSIKHQLKLPLSSGVTWGDFKLPDTLAEGNYRIRAYTQWMRNAGPEFMFDKTIKVGNAWANKVFTKATYGFSIENNVQKVDTRLKFSDKEGKPYVDQEVSYQVQLEDKTVEKGKAKTDENGEVNFAFLNKGNQLQKAGQITATLTLPDKRKVTKIIPVTETSKAIDVQFFPEGGNLVVGLPGKVGIKATAKNGLGKDVSGNIIDQTGQVVTNFKSTYLGMGFFVLNPQPGQSYTAIVNMEDGSEKRIPLPAIQAQGYLLAVNSSNPDKFNIKVLLSPELLKKGELKLVVQHQGQAHAIARIKTDKQIAMLDIPRKDLPSGVIQFTLFDQANQPVAERLAFHKNIADEINLQVKSKQDYKPREKVSLDVLAEANGKPLQGSFSVSVTNTSVVDPDLENESHIFSTLLLSSDLPGYIEKPNLYFLDNSSITLQRLDNLLLTQGWRRFLWKNVINDVSPEMTYQPEKSLSISGTLTTEGGKPISGGQVTLFSSSGGLLTLDTLSDANGKFVFDDLIFGDSTKFVVQGRNAKGKKYTELKIDAIPGLVVTPNKNTGDIAINVNEAIASYVKQSESYFDELTKRGSLQRTIQLQEVNIGKTVSLTKNSANINGTNAGAYDALITAKDLQTCTMLSQCLQGRVAGLVIMDGQAWLTRNSGRQAMTIVLDGVHLQDTRFLDNISPMDVETIEVLKSAHLLSIYGMRASGGVLVITTKRGGQSTYSTYTPGLITYTPKGYSYSREFYSPEYDSEKPNAAPDLRTTVYWNPQVVTDTNGKTKIDYFNTDVPGTYRVHLEGVNAAGQLARSIYTYQVK